MKPRWPCCFLFIQFSYDLSKCLIRYLFEHRLMGATFIKVCYITYLILLVVLNDFPIHRHFQKLPLMHCRLLFMLFSLIPLWLHLKIIIEFFHRSCILLGLLSYVCIGGIDIFPSLSVFKLVFSYMVLE